MNDGVEKKLQNLLIKAWRERWPDLTWGIYVKEVILFYFQNWFGKTSLDYVRLDQD